MTETGNHPNEEPIESWKEIAAYLKRDVRTVKRWEKREGLPVHRQMHQARSSVYAYPSELEAWKIDREPRLNAPPVITPWRRATSGFAIAAAMLLALLTMGSGPIRAPNAAAAEPPDGIINREVWNGPGLDYAGSPSPDGRYLSFVDWTTGDLAIRDLETGKNHRLTNKGQWEKSEEFAEFSRWSPDGKQIAYDWFDGGCCKDLAVVEREGGKPRTLVDHENGEWMQTYDWSPDGKQILIFVEKKDGTRQIVLVSAADGATRAVKTFDGQNGWPHIMRFSRDGQYIAYDWPQQQGSAKHDIFLIPSRGGQEIQLVKHPADDRLLGWPPDGKGILFASDRTGSLDMWFLPISKGEAQGTPEFVKGGIERIVPMGFTRSGSFYYAQGQWMVDVYAARMDPKTDRILAPPQKVIKRFEGRNCCPQYSPDGKHLAYLTTRSRGFQAANRPNILCVHSLETGKDREYTTKFKRLGALRWSPDGKFLYLSAWGDQGVGIYKVEARSGKFKPIVHAQPQVSLVDLDVSSDGNVLFYERYERRDGPAEPRRILSLNLTTGQEKQLYVTGPDHLSVGASVSPDGKWLAFMSGNKEKVLQVIPTAGGEPRVLLRTEEANNYYACIAWAADGKYILFPRVHATKDGQQFALWRIPAKGGEPQELNLVMSYIGSLSAHPDGQHIAFTSLGVTRKLLAIWAMENFLPQTVASK